MKTTIEPVVTCGQGDIEVTVSSAGVVLSIFKLGADGKFIREEDCYKKFYLESDQAVRIVECMNAALKEYQVNPKRESGE